MSLLSDLIAELTALIERSRETRTRLHSADDRLGRVFNVVQGSTVGSNSASVTDGLGHLRRGIGSLEEAQRLLAAGETGLQRYRSLLAGGAGGSTNPSPQARPPLPATSAARSESPPVRGPAQGGIRPPTPGRHRLSRIGRSSQPKNANTVILPSVDVESDLEAIRTGRASFNSATGRYEINGRTWGVKANGTAFPVSGPGLVELSRAQFKALMSLNDAKQPIGVWPKNHCKDRSITASDWDRAAEVYRYHPRHSQGAP